MLRFFEKFISLMFCLSGTILLYMLPGVWGVICAGIMLLFTILCLISDKFVKIPENFVIHHMPLLFDVLVIVAYVLILVFEEGDMLLKAAAIFTPSVIAVIAAIVYWVMDKKYLGRDVRQILFDECRIFSPECDIAIISLNTFLSLKIDGFFSVWTIVVSCVLLADFLFQMFGRKQIMK